MVRPEVDTGSRLHSWERSVIVVPPSGDSRRCGVVSDNGGRTLEAQLGIDPINLFGLRVDASLTKRVCGDDALNLGVRKGIREL